MLATKLRWLFFAIIVSFTPPLDAFTRQEQEQTADLVAPKPEPVVRRINIVSKDLFDADAGFVLAPLLNSLHICTRTSTIQQEILFKPNSRRNQSLIDETERNLRALGLFSEVTINAASTNTDTIELFVTTRDRWSTNLNTSYKRESGIHYFGLGVAEKNLLGLGKSLELSYNHSTERILRQIQWNDSRFLGSRLATSFKVQNNSDRRFYSFAMTRPFYAWQSRWGFTFLAEKIDGVYREYQDGQLIATDPLTNRAGQFILNHYRGERVKTHLLVGAIHQRERIGFRTKSLDLFGAGFG